MFSPAWRPHASVPSFVRQQNASTESCEAEDGIEIINEKHLVLLGECTENTVAVVFQDLKSRRIMAGSLDSRLGMKALLSPLLVSSLPPTWAARSPAQSHLPRARSLLGGPRRRKGHAGSAAEGGREPAVILVL